MVAHLYFSSTHICFYQSNNLLIEMESSRDDEGRSLSATS